MRHAAALLALCAGAAAPAAAQRWVVTAADGCEALTVWWEAPAAAVASLAGKRWAPEPGDSPGTADLGWVVVQCASGAIDGRRVGPHALAAPLVRLAGGRAPGLPDAQVGIGPVIAEPGSPAHALLRAAGLAVVDGVVTFRPRPMGRGARVIATAGDADGRLVVEAEVEPGAAAVGDDAAIASLGDGPVVALTGPVAAVRAGEAAAVVLGEGNTLVARVGLPPRPARVTYDRRCTWDLSFAPSAR
ncbi:MAG: hypothetical protein NW201_04105 [Gemmatimonadales bacterium]|nr:hypothetical protein [Gemmatimonadales bacterium]